MFDPNSHARNDNSGKIVASGFFTLRNWTVIQSGQFDWDLSVSKGDRCFPVEVEVRETIRCWRSGEPFPFSTISIPYRKAFHFDPHAFYFATNSTLSSAVILSGQAIVDALIVERYSENRGIERFAEVPVSSGWQFRLLGTGSLRID